MYVACRPLKVGSRTVQPGECVPEAEQWPETVRRAHLNLEWIKEDAKAVPKAKPVQVSVSAPKAMEGQPKPKAKPKKVAKKTAS